MPVSAHTYYCTFGSPMPNRSWNDPNAKYKYGFNGKEKDNEINVDGGDYDFGARIYNSRLGRWLSFDKYNQFENNYIGINNNPISQFDIDGNWVKGTNGEPVTLKLTTINGVTAWEISANCDLETRELFGAMLNATSQVAINAVRGILATSTECNIHVSDDVGLTYDANTNTYSQTVGMTIANDPTLIDEKSDKYGNENDSKVYTSVDMYFFKGTYAYNQGLTTTLTSENTTIISVNPDGTPNVNTDPKTTNFNTILVPTSTAPRDLYTDANQCLMLTGVHERWHLTGENINISQKQTSQAATQSEVVPNQKEDSARSREGTSNIGVHPPKT